MIYALILACVVLFVLCIFLNRRFFILNVDKARLLTENTIKDERIKELVAEVKILNEDIKNKSRDYEYMSNDKTRLEAENKNKDKLIIELEANVTYLNEQMKQLKENYENTHEDKTKFKAENEAKDRRIKELDRDIEQIREHYKSMFENIKQELEKNAKTQDEVVLDRIKLMFNDNSKKMLDDIFTPIKKSVEEYSQNLIKNESTLKQQIESVFKYSHTMQESAEALSKILKGDKKVRGNFGEMQLKNILDSSGLIQGEHYELQEYFKQEGKGYKPDAVVFLDGGMGKNRRCIIIDSKFSLPNDFAPTLEADIEVEERIAKEIAKNLKGRIDELSKKPYDEYSHYAYDFTLLFVPYNNILDLAIWVDSHIYQYAYNKKIYLVTPYTLFMALKTINITWIHKQREESVQQAFQQINAFYDKFASAVETFEKIKSNLITLQGNVNHLNTQLIDGKGNLSSRFELLKSYGAMPKKQLTLKSEE